MGREELAHGLQLDQYFVFNQKINPAAAQSMRIVINVQFLFLLKCYFGT